MRRASILALLLLAACSGTEAGPDASAPDAGGLDAALDAGPRDLGVADLGVLDAGAPDVGAPDAGPSDAAPADAGAPDAGPPPVGVITGACGELDDELTSPAPSTFVNHIDFADMGFTEADRARLTEDGRTVLDTPNAGGSSLLSEVFSFEILARCEGAALLLTENEVDYDPMQSKKTDLVVEIDGLRIGVSVTRAVIFPRDAPYTVARSVELLTDKLSDVLESSANVVPEQAWRKQILHVIAYGQMHADSIVAAEAMIPAEVRADTILWVSVSDGDDAFLYD